MKKKKLQVVSFENAKRLKKLGFNWKTKKKYAAETDYHNQTKEGEIYSDKGICGSDYYAPTIQLALKYIRDEKELVGYVEYDYEYMEYCYVTPVGKSATFRVYEDVEKALLNKLLTYLENNDE